MRQKPNRVVEDTGRLGLPVKTVKVYHAHDEGDWHILPFELQRGLSDASIEKAALHYGKQWVDKNEKLGFKINRASILPLMGPYPCQELDKLDMEIWVWKARFWREKPQLVTPEYARTLLANQPEQDTADIRIYSKPAQMSMEVIEANARAQAAAAKLVPSVKAAQEEVAEMRRDKGLTPFKSETVLEKYGLNERKDE